MKTCSRCKTPKPLDHFSVSNFESPDGRYRWCKPCAATYRLERRQNAEYVARVRAVNLEWARANQPRMKALAAAHRVQRKADKVAGRLCDWCGKPLPFAKRSHAKYCSPNCSSRIQSTRRKQRGVTFLGRKVRRAIYERDNGACHICGLFVHPFDFQIDHIVPVSKGGPTEEANLAVCHTKCNQRKGNRLSHSKSR